VQSLPGIIHGLQDPLGAFLQMLTGVLSHFIDTARNDLNSELSRYSSPPSIPLAADRGRSPQIQR
jgi:hypothetical protein